jgi:hypothetical protein
MEEFPILGVNMNSTPSPEGPPPEAVANAIQQMIHDYEEGGMADTVPFTHVLTALMMEVFAPGFIIIGSPHTIPSHDGIDLPADCGFIINGNTNMTATTVGHFLGLLSDLIDESSEAGLIDLTDIYGEEE